MSERKHRLVDCNPRWGESAGVRRYITFDCPEGHADCRHSIPFSPALDGSPQTSPQQNGAQWERRGDTFETLVLGPSIRRVPQYASRESAIADGCIPEYITDASLCAFHGFIGGSSGQSPGAIEFCGDSK